jgi:hypothetical protein
MKTEMARRTVIVIGTRGSLPALIGPDDRGGEVLVLALGPRVNREQRRVVEEAIGLAFEYRVPFEARMVTASEAASILAGAWATDAVRALGCSRRELRSFRRLRPRRG